MRLDLPSWTLLLATALLGGCGSGGAPSTLQPSAEAPPPGGEAPPATLTESLVALGVDISAQDEPRLDAEGAPYPETYSPFGQRFEMTELADGSVIFGRPTKLMLVGPRPKGTTSTLTVFDNIARPSGAPWVIAPTRLRQGSPAWAKESVIAKISNGTRRDTTACDVDGDGHDELVYVHVDASGLHLEVVQGDDDGSADVNRLVPVAFALANVNDVRVVGGDFDGDGRCELAIGISRSADHVAEVLVLDDPSADFAILRTFSFAGSMTNSNLQLVLKAGSVDYDAQPELAVVVNERTGSDSNAQGTAVLHVLDDAAAGYAELHQGPVQVVLEAGTVAFAVADVDIGDLDRDGAGELLLAGLDRIIRTRNADGPDASSAQHHVLVSLDDALHGFAQTAGCKQMLLRPKNPESNPWLTAFVHVNALDIDGDEDLEIQVDGFVFDRVPDPGTSWTAIGPPGSGSPGDNWAYRLIGTYPFPEDDSLPGWTLDRGFASVRVADADGDGRKDVISYRAGQVNGETAAYVEFHGVDADGHFSRWGRIAVEFDNAAAASHPILVPVSAPLNGQVSQTSVLAFDRHTAAFTEPTVIALLAAPPYVEGIDQNYDDCTTTFGLSKSTGIEGEREIKISVGVGVQLGSESTPNFTAKLAASWSRARSDAYEVTKSFSFTTGPGEDSVVFSSIPVDAYTYHVIAHPNVGKIGNKITMSLPREAVVRIATIEYFDAHIPIGATRWGDYFKHEPGQIRTYRTAAEKDFLLTTERSMLEDSRVSYNLLQDGRAVFEPVEALRGLETEAVGVGQGHGSTEVALEVVRETSQSRAFSLGFEAELELTKGFGKLIFTFGFEAEWTTKITLGTGTNFVGTVGSIGADDFAANQYKFGLFSYLHADPDSHREFHVVNYWVEDVD